MSFVMYSTTWCGYCKRLKSQLADLGVTFEEINIEEVPGTAEIVEKVNGGNRTVPTLVFSDGAAMTNPSPIPISLQAGSTKTNSIAHVFVSLGVDTSEPMTVEPTPATRVKPGNTSVDDFRTEPRY